jgi:AhpD family alkylhydroperoxidase
MSRIRPADKNEGGLLLRYLNRKGRRGFGKEPLPQRVLARNPRFVPAYFFMSRRFLGGKTELDPAIRQLALQVVSTHNGCSWCSDFGAAKASRLGVDADKLESVLDFQTSARVRMGTGPQQRKGQRFRLRAAQGELFGAGSG